MKWSHLKLPWVDIDWLIDISCQITELDLSANCLSSLPSVIPWGLINLRKLNLSDNHLAELPGVQSSDEIICSRWAFPVAGARGVSDGRRGALCAPAASASLPRTGSLTVVCDFENKFSAEIRKGSSASPNTSSVFGTRSPPPVQGNAEQGGLCAPPNVHRPLAARRTCLPATPLPLLCPAFGNQRGLVEAVRPKPPAFTTPPGAGGGARSLRRAPAAGMGSSVPFWGSSWEAKALRVREKDGCWKELRGISHRWGQKSKERVPSK